MFCGHSRLSELTKVVEGDGICGCKTEARIFWVSVLSTDQSSCSAHWEQGGHCVEANLLMTVTKMQPNDSTFYLGEQDLEPGRAPGAVTLASVLRGPPPSADFWQWWFSSQTQLVLMPNRNKRSSLVHSGEVQTQFVPVSARCLIVASTSLATESLVIYCNCHSPGHYAWSLNQHLAELQAKGEGLWRTQTWLWQGRITANAHQMGKGNFCFSGVIASLHPWVQGGIQTALRPCLQRNSQPPGGTLEWVGCQPWLLCTVQRRVTYTSCGENRTSKSDIYNTGFSTPVCVNPNSHTKLKISHSSTYYGKSYSLSTAIVWKSAKALFHFPHRYSRNRSDCILYWKKIRKCYSSWE